MINTFHTLALYSFNIYNNIVFPSMPSLYLLYTSDLPTFKQNVVATFADDTAIMAIGDSNTESTEGLQAAVAKVQRWTRKWRI